MAPRIGEAPISFECRLHTAVEIGASVWVIGQVLYVHIRDDLLTDSFDVRVDALHPLGRMAGPTFCTELKVLTRSVELRDPSTRRPSRLRWLPDHGA